MPRILFFVFIAFLVWLLVRVLGGKRRQEEAKPVSTPPLEPPEVIRQCAWCGVHVPTGEAVTLPDGRLYCSEVHREAALAAASDRAAL